MADNSNAPLKYPPHLPWLDNIPKMWHYTWVWYGAVDRWPIMKLDHSEEASFAGVLYKGLEFNPTEDWIEALYSIHRGIKSAFLVEGRPSCDESKPKRELYMEFSSSFAADTFVEEQNKVHGDGAFERCLLWCQAHKLENRIAYGPGETQDALAINKRRRRSVISCPSTPANLSSEKSAQWIGSDEWYEAIGKKEDVQEAKEKLVVEAMKNTIQKKARETMGRV